MLFAGCAGKVLETADLASCTIKLRGDASQKSFHSNCSELLIKGPGGGSGRVSCACCTPMTTITMSVMSDIMMYSTLINWVSSCNLVSKFTMVYNVNITPSFKVTLGFTKLDIYP